MARKKAEIPTKSYAARLLLTLRPCPGTNGKASRRKRHLRRDESRRRLKTSANVASPAHTDFNMCRLPVGREIHLKLSKLSSYLHYLRRLHRLVQFRGIRSH